MRQLKGTEQRSAPTISGCVAVFLFGVLLLSSVASGAVDAPASEGFQIRGEFLEPGENVSAGGPFGVTGKSVLPSNGIGSREFTLESTGPKRGDETSGCPCQGLFADGFESGNLGAWSAAS